MLLILTREDLNGNVAQIPIILHNPKTMLADTPKLSRSTGSLQSTPKTFQVHGVTSINSQNFQNIA